ncbi:MAG: hypothetical protein JWN27_2915 [Candidatus Eremiobacteraeota bacterium]|nr:hypothetical protein [Candidatus Eremiobacteraeota bacterium]
MSIFAQIGYLLILIPIWIWQRITGKQSGPFV